MIPAKKSLHRPFRLFALALSLILVTAETGAAQQFLGNARQRCQGPVTLVTPGSTLEVRQFEARSAEVGNATVSWKCQDQQQVDIQCPPNTNKVLIDRSQGGSVFSIICLHR